MNILKIKKSNFICLIFIFICCMPFLSLYNNSFIVYGQFGIIILFLLFHFSKFKSLNQSYLIVYLLWSIITLLLNGTDNTVGVNRYFSTFLVILMTLCLSNRYNLDGFVKVYSCFAMFAVLFMVIQILIFYVFNQAIMFRIPFLTLNENLDYAYKYLSYLNRTSIYVRFPGPFSEPAMYSEYVLPLFLLYLTGYKNIIIVNKKKAIIIASTIVMSTSGIGIMMVGVLFLASLFYQGKLKLNTLIRGIISLVAVFSIFLVLYNTSETVNYTVSNLFVAKDSTSSKADYRIYRGISYYIQSPVSTKIVGTGFYNATNYFSKIGVTTDYDKDDQYSEYYNGISQIALYTGIVGFTIWISFIIECYRSSEKTKIFTIAYILLALGSSYVFDGNAAIYILFIFTMKGENKCKKIMG